MIGLKDQCFGVEVEMTGITREQAATALAAYFATDARYVGGAYDKWCVTDPKVLFPTLSSILSTSAH